MIAATGIREIPPDGSFEEALAPFASILTVMLSTALVAANDAFDIVSVLDVFGIVIRGRTRRGTFSRGRCRWFFVLFRGQWSIAVALGGLEKEILRLAEILPTDRIKSEDLRVETIDVVVEGRQVVVVFVLRCQGIVSADRTDRMKRRRARGGHFGRGNIY